MMMAVIGFTEPMNNKLLNLMELVNEAFILLFTYHLYLFTDFMSNLDHRMLFGKILVYFTMLNITLNFVVVVQENVDNLI